MKPVVEVDVDNIASPSSVKHDWLKPSVLTLKLGVRSVLQLRSIGLLAVDVALDFLEYFYLLIMGSLGTLVGGAGIIGLRFSCP